MKTLIFTLEYKPFNGGVAEYYSALFENWPNKDIFILTVNTQEKIEESERVIREKLISPVFSWLSSFFILSSVIKKKKINHIVVGHILPLGTVTYFLSFVLRFKYSVVLHGMDFSFSQKSKRKKKISFKILEKSEKIICGNSYLAKNISEKYPELKDKISVVNPGVKRRELAGFKKSSEIFNIFFIGRLVKRKGVDRVIEAFSFIDKEKFSNINFLIAGAGPDEEYLKNISDDRRVRFIGKISDEEKWRYMEEADLFAMPTRNIDGDYEGFGIVYLEANLMQTTVLAVDSGGVADAVKDSVGGILMENDKPEEIAREIINLYYNREKNMKIAKRGRERVLNYFLWKKQVDNFFNILNK